MSFGGFILIPVKNIVCQYFQVESERKKRLDPTTFYPQLFKSILFFTQLFTTLTL